MQLRDSFVDLVVLNYNDSESTIGFLQLMESHSCIRYIVIVDNCSTDESYGKLKMHENSKVIVLRTDFNGGYGYGNNFGCKYCREKLGGKYILICNPDTYIENQTILAMLSQMMSEKKAIICSCVMTDKLGNRCKNTAWRIPTYYQIIMHDLIFPEKFLGVGYQYYNIESKENINVECVQGSLYLLDVDKFIDIGGFDEEVFLFNEENIIGHKIKTNKYDVILLTDFEYWHLHSVSINKSYSSIKAKWKLDWDSQKIYLKKYLHINKIGILCAYVIMIMRLLEIEVKCTLVKNVR